MEVDMKRSLVCSLVISVIFFCVSCTHQTGNEEPVKEHMTRDEKIAALKEQRRVYLFRAQYFRREADRVLTQNWLQYRQCVVQQQYYEKLAKETEVKIEQLEKR